MIRVSGTNSSAPAAGPRKSAKAGDGFRVGAGPKAAGATTSSAPSAPAETLSALIALQSGATNDGHSRTKDIVAAQRILDLLERLRMGLLDSAVSVDDLDAIARATSNAPAMGARDAALSALYDEIALRARVELAKLGR